MCVTNTAVSKQANGLVSQPLPVFSKESALLLANTPYVILYSLPFTVFMCSSVLLYSTKKICRIKMTGLKAFNTSPLSKPNYTAARQDKHPNKEHNTART